ncbi:hypothetical protein [Noviherbaspirillum sedimenti]|nr:hypothetical protein [Noviherbaspirillum sedimenti]
MATNTTKARVSGLDIGWLIGFLEGEGSICLLVNRRKNRTQTLRVVPKVIWTNCDYAMIEKCVDILKRMGVDSVVPEKNPRNNPNGLVKNGSKAIYYVNVWGLSRIGRLFSFIGGRIVGEKAERVDVLHRFIQRRLALAEKLQLKHLHYDQVDVKLMLEFLVLTKCRSIERVTRLLEAYTSNARYADRSTDLSEFAAPGERSCSLPDCNRKHYGLGYCSRHWQQHRAGIELPSPPERTKSSSQPISTRASAKPLMQVLQSTACSVKPKICDQLQFTPQPSSRKGRQADREEFSIPSCLRKPRLRVRATVWELTALPV